MSVFDSDTRSCCVRAHTETALCLSPSSHTADDGHWRPTACVARVRCEQATMTLRDETFLRSRCGRAHCFRVVHVLTSRRRHRVIARADVSQNLCDCFGPALAYAARGGESSAVARRSAAMLLAPGIRPLCTVSEVILDSWGARPRHSGSMYKDFEPPVIFPSHPKSPKDRISYILH